MYLARSHPLAAAATRRMVGAIPGDVVMHERPVGRGYVQLAETADISPGRRWRLRDTVRRATSSTTPASRTCHPAVQFAYRVQRGHGIDGRARRRAACTTCWPRTPTCAHCARQPVAAALRRLRASASAGRRRGRRSRGRRTDPAGGLSAGATTMTTHTPDAHTAAGTCVLVNGRRIETDSEGYLCRPRRLVGGLRARPGPRARSWS